jgi:hypothetical protein
VIWKKSAQAGVGAIPISAANVQDTKTANALHRLTASIADGFSRSARPPDATHATGTTPHPARTQMEPFDSTTVQQFNILLQYHQQQIETPPSP